MANELQMAKDLLGLKTVPVDIEKKIQALYKSASDSEKQLFPEIFEGMFVLLNKDASRG